MGRVLMDINDLRRLYEMGQISSAELDDEERKNALAEMVMPQPRYDIEPMEQNSMRFENGPDQGRTVPLGAASPEAQQANLKAHGLDNRQAFEHYIRTGELPQKQAAPVQAPQKLGAAVEVVGKGRGRYSQDGRKVVFADGSEHDLHPARSALEAKAKFMAEKQALDLERGRTDIAATQQQMEMARAPRQQAAPAGYRWTPGGGLEAIPGGPADPSMRPEKPMTDVQGRSSTYGQRAAESHEVLNSTGQDGKVQPSLIKRTAATIPLIGGALEMAANAVASPEQRQVEQAERNFINAVLRRESGAVISDKEFDNARKQYFPQPNDDPKTVELKRLNRETVIRGFADEAGPAREKVIQAGERAKSGPQGMPDPAQNAGRAGTDSKTGVRYRSDGKRWVRID